MNIALKCRKAAACLGVLAGAVFLSRIFAAWLQPSTALALLDGLFLCR